ncbi:hypothetical protein HOF92_13265 [bacterium]|jgi:hypothetical protein|nr:hypothetical protein [bacterium]
MKALLSAVLLLSSTQVQAHHGYWVQYHPTLTSSSAPYSFQGMREPRRVLRMRPRPASSHCCAKKYNHSYYKRVKAKNLQTRPFHSMKVQTYDDRYRQPRRGTYVTSEIYCVPYCEPKKRRGRFLGIF